METLQTPDRLSDLLKKNAYTQEGLTQAERLEAEALIEFLPRGEDNCWVCLPNRPQKAIAGIGLCQGHATYALITRK